MQSVPAPPNLRKTSRGNELSYLVPVDSSGDIHAQGYQKTVTYSKDELKKLLETYQPTPNLSQDTSEWLSILERSGSGYVTLIRVGDTQMSGIEFRELLGLRSSDFDFSFDGRNLYLHDNRIWTRCWFEPVRRRLSCTSGKNISGDFRALLQRCNFGREGMIKSGAG